MIEGKSYQAAEFSAKAARIQLKLKNLDGAAKMTQTQLVHLQEVEDSRMCGRTIVCLIIIELARDDFVAAKKVYLDGQR